MAKEKWAQVLNAVDRPLRFFALALLIVDGAIGMLAGLALEGNHRFYAVLIMAGLFLVVVIIVGVITFLRPKNLQAQLEELEDIISSKGFTDAIEEIVEEKLNAERQGSVNGPRIGRPNRDEGEAGV